MSNVLYTPFRSIGYVCDKNQFVVNRLGEENFLTVTIGNCFQIFRLNHKLAVCLVSKPLQSSQSSIGLSSYRISSIQVIIWTEVDAILN